MNIIDWLEREETYPKFYFRSGCQKHHFATSGILRHVSHGERPKNGELFVGALPFSSTSHWEQFPTTLFVPKNIRHAEKTFSAAPSTFPENRLLKTNYLPDENAWAEITNHPHEKVVLSRKTTLHFEENLPSFTLLKRLISSSSSATLFLYQISPEVAFVGATPELLFKLNGSAVSIDALAGTRKRGKTEEEDNSLAKELLSNQKEQKEFLFVKNYLIDVAEHFATNLHFHPCDQIKKTPTVQHIYNELTGTLKSDISPWEVIDALHPTPAMGGTPKKEAIDYIEKHEPFKRGFFTAPIGFMSKNRANFGVAIRCGLIENNQLSLFAGAGILAESDPAREWEELSHKKEVIKKCLI